MAIRSDAFTNAKLVRLRARKWNIGAISNQKIAWRPGGCVACRCMAAPSLRPHAMAELDRPFLRWAEVSASGARTCPSVSANILVV